MKLFSIACFFAAIALAFVMGLQNEFNQPGPEGGQLAGFEIPNEYMQCPSYCQGSKGKGPKNPQFSNDFPPE